MKMNSNIDSKSNLVILPQDELAMLENPTVAVGATKLDSFAEPPGNNNIGSLMDHPEAKMIMNELEKRLATLENMMDSIPESYASKNDNDQEEMTVTISSEQAKSLNGLSSNIRGLIKCLTMRHGEQLEKILQPQDVNTRSISEKKMLNDLIGPERNSMLPKELIMGMMTEDPESVSSAAYLAHEFGGVALPTRFTVAKPKKKSIKGFATALVNAKRFVGGAKVDKGPGSDYLPWEFTRLGLKERKRLTRLLSWEGLKVWEFDSFEVDKLSTITIFQKSSAGLDSNEKSQELPEDDAVESSKHGCPIVLIGWALFASPYSQLAMAKNTNDQELIDRAYKAIKKRAATRGGQMADSMLMGGVSDYLDESSEESEKRDSSHQADESTDAWNGGYFLPDQFGVDPKAMCRILRKVESEYSPIKVNPYHNNVHGADVVQSTHSLIQMGGSDMELAYTPLETYAILMAAVLHDVGHPGTNNSYQVNKMTDLSLVYNDNSVLENMHASRASYLLEDKNEGTGHCEAVISVLGTMTKEQKKIFRTSMTRSILSTDMSRHFAEVAKISSHLVSLENELPEDSPLGSVLSRLGEHITLREELLPLILHLADISNPAKPHHISLAWSDCAYGEFFLQGDKEAAEGLPISFLCDRATTNRPEAQLGFMNFVVKPAYSLLARCIPNVESIVLSQLEENTKYWEGEKAKVSMSGTNES